MRQHRQNFIKKFNELNLEKRRQLIHARLERNPILITYSVEMGALYNRKLYNRVKLLNFSKRPNNGGLILEEGFIIERILK